jgi:hypothetical protein
MLDSSLVAFSTDIEAVEDKPVSFHLRGEDRSGFNRTLKIQVNEISRHGRLFGDNGELLENGVLLPGSIVHPYDDGLFVKFRSNKDFFNEPYSSERRSLDCSIYFSVLAPAVAENDTLVESSRGRMIIKVVNVNDVPVLSVPYSDNVVETFSSLSWDRNECGRGHITSKCKSKVVINNIKVNDVDGNLDFVRVDISSSHGILSLNEVHVNKTDFTSCSNRSQFQITEDILWNCQGAGIGDQKVSLHYKNMPIVSELQEIRTFSFYNEPPTHTFSKMTFTARPLHLNDILSDMTYESIEPGEDNIIITVYDGVRGECLSEFEHNQRSMMNSYMGKQTLHLGRCHSVVRSISVNVKKHKSPDLHANRIFPVQLLVAIVFAGLVLFTVFVIVPLSRCFRRKKGRRKNKWVKKGLRRNKKNPKCVSKESCVDVKLGNESGCSSWMRNNSFVGIEEDEERDEGEDHEEDEGEDDEEEVSNSELSSCEYSDEEFSDSALSSFEGSEDSISSSSYKK